MEKNYILCAAESLHKHCRTKALHGPYTEKNFQAQEYTSTEMFM